MPNVLNLCIVRWQYHIWDTVNTELASDEEYSPTVPGEYTWPFEGATDYYSALIAGPLPPYDCASSAPAGTELVGCFTDSASDRLLNSNAFALNKRGPGGMTAQVINSALGNRDMLGSSGSCHYNRKKKNTMNIVHGLARRSPVVFSFTASWKLIAEHAKKTQHICLSARCSSYK